MKQIKSKKALEMSFSFIFAMIVGAAILVLAIYGVTNLIRNADVSHGSVISKEISIIVDPLQTNIESSREMSIELPQETRIKNKCYPYGDFGSQGLTSSVKGINDEYGKEGVEVSVSNKYLFTPEIMEGKKLYLFSKAFDFPFKIGDVIVVTSENYCFVRPPQHIDDEISRIKNSGGMQNIEINNSEEDCGNNSIKVCFEDMCDISVFGTCVGCENEFEVGFVEKGNDKLYYSGNLIYGAIFSDGELYECNIKRMMKRLNYQGLLFMYESDIIAKQNCITGIDADIGVFVKASGNLNNSIELLSLRDMSESLNRKNSEAKGCELW